MGLFKRYRHHYKEPERFTPSEIRANRLAAMLEREHRFLQVANFPERLTALSQANKKENVISRKFVNDRQVGGHKAALIAAAISQFKEKDFSDPFKRAQYRALRVQQELLRRVGSSRRGQKKVSPTGADKRLYDPTGKSYAVLKSGNVAPLKTSGWIQAFRFPAITIPCVQRKVRRQVMFASGYAGRGYKVRHRRTWSSDIPC